MMRRLSKIKFPIRHQRFFTTTSRSSSGASSSKSADSSGCLISEWKSLAKATAGAVAFGALALHVSSTSTNHFERKNIDILWAWITFTAYQTYLQLFLWVCVPTVPSGLPLISFHFKATHWHLPAGHRECQLSLVNPVSCHFKTIWKSLSGLLCNSYTLVKSRGA